MDGAVDAMTRMGFSVTLIKKVAKQLLKNESKNEALAEASGVAKDTKISDNALVGAVRSSSAVKPTHAEGVTISPGIDAGEENARGWKDIGLDQNSSRKRANVGEYGSSRSSLPTFPLVIPSPALVTKRRLPCYGWLESNDEDDQDCVFHNASGINAKSAESLSLGKHQHCK